MEHIKNILITGGGGFIGGALVRKLLKDGDHNVFNLDKLSDRSDLSSINNLVKKRGIESQKYVFIKCDLLDQNNLKKAVRKADPDIVFHFAAESHVDRSIKSPKDCLFNNVVATFNLLEVIKDHFFNLNEGRSNNFRFHHISTDEVFGSINSKGKFSEDSRYDPRSPYSATKASSDHLVNAWHHTYGIPVITTNASNNYGPWQFPEKLIPLVILKSLSLEKIPLYGDGMNIRDWIHVDDHIEAILLVSKYGQIGKKYLIGGNNERRNKDVVFMICDYLDEVVPRSQSYKELITYVNDRPGHDYRYALDSSLIKNELNWEAKIEFKEGLNKTIDWYLNNLNWCSKMSNQSGYNGQRIGLLNS